MNAVLYVSYHSNREVVVDDFVGHRVTSLLTVLQGHLYAPAIHRNHRTALNVLQDPAQIHTIISYGIITVKNTKYIHKSTVQVQSFKFRFCPHLLPIEDSVQDHFLCQEEARPPGGALASWLCLNEELKRTFG